MSRRVFASAVLLLFVVMMCSSGRASNAVTSNSGNVQLPHTVDLFLPNQTLVVSKDGRSQETKRDAFVSPSLVSAGGVIAAFAEGHMETKYQGGQSTKPSSDVVAEYIDSAWDWPTLVEKVNKDTWRAHTVLGAAEGKDYRMGGLHHPTSITRGNKVFLLAGGFGELKESGGNWEWGKFELTLVVGDVTNSTPGDPGGRIKWGDPRPLFDSKYSLNHKSKLNTFFASGGSGVLMEDGAIVFSLMAVNEKNDGVLPMIIYSTDDGSTWLLSEDISPANCFNPHITKWEGKLLMIVDCEKDQRVYESRDMGTTWTEAIGTLPGVWVKSQLGDYPDEGLHVDALITATIEGRKVMLYTQRGNFSGETERTTALYVWVTDNNRSFSVGPVGMDNAVKGELAGALLYSDGYLHLLQQRVSAEGSAISLSRLTEELKKIESVLSTWAQLDAFFSKLSIPTAGLVAVLSNASASNDMWYDEYLCLNATVNKAVKAADGLKLMEPDSRVMWPVNIRESDVRHISLSQNFTLVATVIIEETPTADAPLLYAELFDAGPPYIIRLSYTADSKWETMVKGDTKTTTESGTWVAGKEYQVALMLQGNKASVHIDGKSLGKEEALSTDERPLDVAGFCFGACGMKNSPVTVANVFLYNRPLNPTEMNAIKDRKPVPTRGSESQAGGVPQTIASAVSGPEKNSAAPAMPMTLDPHAVEEVSEGGAAKRNTSRTEDVQFVVPEVSLNSAGSGLLPLLLLLLGLWGFAAA
ncbi:putative trans-sialidase, Group II [Trypanosoma cruzi]|uniref:Trans-sialidase, putative n=2 Tax=Trypanosoma cruzi TaxID=5693 RepID=Q4CWN6_TRYCC|nr:trans-sialidase, putative [Trypanosoma cruzi]EAN84690.1 trans-sialidase, putative [Trypanosoma cruzi]PWU90297.1 putative trans-sialidase, Group II [Trypanosoma cruzi]|eukprot:XP_806541.1 trans-sialidase [Trypanosoma cruzi strain CL Brener]